MVENKFIFCQDCGHKNLTEELVSSEILKETTDGTQKNHFQEFFCGECLTKIKVVEVVYRTFEKIV